MSDASQIERTIKAAPSQTKMLARGAGRRLHQKRPIETDTIPPAQAKMAGANRERKASNPPMDSMLLIVGDGLNGTSEGERLASA